MLLKIAFKTLVFDVRKLLVGLIGVVFSVVLANVQGGLFWGLIHRASILVEESHATIWVGHRGMHNVDFPADIPKRWIQRIRGISDVEKAEAMTVGFSEMKLPNGAFEGVVIVGSEPDSYLGRAWDKRADGDPLQRSDGVIVDVYDADKLSDPRIGELREIGGMKARIVGNSRGLLSFLVTPYVFTTLERANRFTRKDPSLCSYILIRLRPNSDADQVCREIERRLPYAQAYTADKYAAISVQFWLTRTGIGISFGAATLLGLLVGLIMVSQSLYAIVLDRVSEYATLKAMGASEREIVAILIGQASGIAGLGILLGLVVTCLVWMVFDSPRAPICISPQLMAISSCSIFMMCLLASSLPYLRIRSIDAHTVLQG